jgi:hypothetical protein
VPEWRMTEVMGKAGGFDYAGIEAATTIDITAKRGGARGLPLQHLGYALPDLGDLQAVGESIVDEIAFVLRSHDLGHASEAAKRRRVQDSIAISLGFASLVRARFRLMTPRVAAA